MRERKLIGRETTWDTSEIKIKINIFRKQSENRYTLEKRLIYSQTCVQRQPLGPEKSGRLKEGPYESQTGTIILFKCIYRGAQSANLPFDKSNLKFRERRKEVVGS